MTVAEWFYTSAGEQQGPVSAGELKALVGAGHLNREDLVWKQGMMDWQRASQIKGLFPLPSVPPPLPTNSSTNPKPRSRQNVFAASRISLPLHLQRIGLLAAGVFGVLGVFLPWLSLPIVGTIYGISVPDGWITLVMFLPCFIIPFLGNWQSLIVLWQRFVVSVPSLLGSGIAAYKVVSVGNQMSSIPEEAGNNQFAAAVATAMAKTVQIGPGLYLLIPLGLIIALVAFLLPVVSSEAE